jgi:hypothetical protein
MDFTGIFSSSVCALKDYLSAHVLSCLIPAFFIAGAIAAFVSGGAVLKYFGSQTKKHISYSVASVSGTILAVCSCTVLPLFAGIYKCGAGIGPAINLLAIVYTARLIGFELGAARALAAVAFSIIVGLIMAFIYGNEDKKAKIVLPNSQGKNPMQLMILFVILVAILIFGAAEYISREMKIITLVTLLFALAIVLKNWFVLKEISSWAGQTYCSSRVAYISLPWRKFA